MESPRDGAPENPFDDPEFREFAEQMGIVHKPGMAQELMNELAPLLAAEGVDLDAPEGLEDLTEEDLNAALDAATERYNMELHTPTGEDRLAAFEVLNSCAEAIGRGDSALAGLIIATLHPEGFAPWPAISHVIGVGLGQLDEWGRSADLRKAFTAAKLPHWDWRGTKAAKDVLRTARKGAAFDDLHRLTVTYRGLGLLYGTMLAYSGVIGGAARMWKGDVPSALAELDVPRSPDVRDAIEWLERDHELAEELEDWFVSTYTRLAQNNPGIEDEDLPPLELADLGENLTLAEDITQIFASARGDGINPYTPEGASQILDVVSEMLADANDDDDPEAADSLRDNAHSIRETMTTYAFFRMSYGQNVEAWQSVLDHAEAVRTIGDYELEALESLPFPDDDELRAALATLPIVTAVPELIEWAADAPKGTRNGGLRRIDIEPVAKMLGLDIVGQAKVPRVWQQDHEDRTRYVHSMTEASELNAWIRTLDMMNIVTFDGVGFYPASQAMVWEHPEAVSTEELEGFVGAFLTVFLLGPLDSGGNVRKHRYTVNLISILSEVLEFEPVLREFPEGASYGSMLPGRFGIDVLEQLGFLTQHPADLENDPRRVLASGIKMSGATGPEEIEIPAALHRTIAGALMVVLNHLRE